MSEKNWLISKWKFIPDIMSQPDEASLNKSKILTTTSPEEITEKLDALKRIFSELQKFENLITPKNNIEPIYTRAGSEDVKVTKSDQANNICQSKLSDFDAYLKSKTSRLFGGKTSILYNAFKKLQAIFHELSKHYRNGGKPSRSPTEMKYLEGYDNWTVQGKNMKDIVTEEDEEFLLDGKPSRVNVEECLTRITELFKLFQDFDKAITKNEDVPFPADISYKKAYLTIQYETFKKYIDSLSDSTIGKVSITGKAYRLKTILDLKLTPVYNGLMTHFDAGGKPSTHTDWLQKQSGWRVEPEKDVADDTYKWQNEKPAASKVTEDGEDDLTSYKNGFAPVINGEDVGLSIGGRKKKKRILTRCRKKKTIRKKARRCKTIRKKRSF